MLRAASHPAAPRLGASAKIAGEEVADHPVPDWPTRLAMSAGIKKPVDEKWGELGL